MKKISLEKMQEFKEEFNAPQGARDYIKLLKSSNLLLKEESPCLTKYGLQWMHGRVDILFFTLFKARHILKQKIIINSIQEVLLFALNDANLDIISSFLKKMNKCFE